MNSLLLLFNFRDNVHTKNLSVAEDKLAVGSGGADSGPPDRLDLSKDSVDIHHVTNDKFQQLAICDSTPSAQH